MAALPVESRIETTHLRYSPLEVAAVAPKARIRIDEKRCTVIDDPVFGMLSGRIKAGPVGMAALPVESRIETTHLRYSPLEVTAVAPKAPAWTVHKRCSMIYDPICCVLSR
jgi:hypothetical protein